MSDTPPMITVGMPTYKRINYLRAALDSALSQDYPSFEIIVHDDTQDDSIRSIVESCKSDKIRYQQNNPPVGVVKKLNDFLNMAKGEWLVILCDDDVFEPGFLKAVGAMASEHPNAGLIRTKFKLIGKDGGRLGEDQTCDFELPPYKFASRIFDIHNRLFTMNVTGIAFRPGRLKDLGGFRQFYGGNHLDIFTWFLLGSSAPSYCDPRPLCSLRMHQGSLTNAQNNPKVKETLEANFWVQREVEAVIERLEAGAKTEQEKRLAAETRRVFGMYFSEWVSVYDAAFEYSLANDPSPWKSFGQTLNAMKRLKVPLYRRLAIYLALAPAPLWLRKKALGRYLKYRHRRLQEHYEKQGVLA